MMYKSVAVFFTLALFATLRAQEFIPLWPANRMPDSKGLPLKDSIKNDRAYCIATPGMYAFFPSHDDNNHAAVLIFPGGGYDHLTYDLGGFQLAKWFNTQGMSAFVVMYRLPTSPDLVNREQAPLLDAQRAIRVVRNKAALWNIDPDKIGVQGSSAGGHLAAMTGTAADEPGTHDSLKLTSARPDFMILVSPVIDMNRFAHPGSKRNLLGSNPSIELANDYSVQLHVTSQTPPCFIADAFNDPVVSPQNSLLFYQALLDHHVLSSFHVFPQGGHSIGLTNNPGSAALWLPLCSEWLKETGIVRGAVNNNKK
jgi:acetyl esterase/lipase